MVCVLIQGVGKTVSTLTGVHLHHSMLKMNTTLFLIALCTVILQPDMQVFCNNLLLCQTFLLGVNHMRVVVLLGAVFPIETIY